MDIKELEKQIKKDFNNAICVVGLCHTWVFVYLSVGKIASYRMLTMEGRWVMLITMSLLLLGIVTARKILWNIITRLFDFNQQVIKLQADVVEKNRLAAITETAMALSHEINNPLIIVRGSIEVLEDDFSKRGAESHLKERLAKIKNHCDRIGHITNKLSNLSKVADVAVHGDRKMIDADKSEQKKPRIFLDEEGTQA